MTERPQVGWMFRRTKKQANWTPWAKMWFVLTPCKLNYYETPSDRNEAGEVILSADIEVKGLSKIKGVVQEFEERFHLMEGPQSITECRVKSADDRVAWVAAIDAAKYASNIERTPMQLLLSRLSSESDSDATNTRKDIEACREILKKTNISVASEPVEHTNISKDDREDQAYDKKFKAAFCKIDTSGNGLIDMAEFSVFFKQLGLNMDEEGVRKIFNTIDVDKSGQLSLDEFTNYFTAMVVKDESDDSSEDYLRKAFMEADRDKTGCLDFKEFSDYVWDKKRDKRMGKVMEAFNKMTAGGKRSLTPEQFADLTKAHISTGDTTDSADIDPKLGNQLQKFFEDVEGDEIVEFIEERWDVFTGFKRYDKTGQLVMTGAEEMVADFVPGQYSLVDLACFSDLPPIEPNYRTVKATWKTSTVKGKSGQIIFPADFDGKVPLDIATSEHLRYYGCSFADTKQTKISLLYRHGIQDFTYENAYLDDFVLATRGGAGLETHQFAHLDCPVDDDNGVFVLGKLVDDDTLHLTGFTVPQRHTLYLPAGAIHSNDYLKGTWRTMLSDEAIIDHVVTMAEKKDSDELRNVTLTFQ